MVCLYRIIFLPFPISSLREFNQKCRNVNPNSVNTATDLSDAVKTCLVKVLLKCNLRENYCTYKKNYYLHYSFKDPPFVTNLTKQDIEEGLPLSVICGAIPGNPINTSYFWTSEDNKDFIIQLGATLRLSNIQRNSSGIYKCTAENTYSDGKKGKHSMSMVVNVLCKSTVIFATL